MATVPIDGEVLRFFINDVLTPTLWPVHVVIMDNLAAHRVADIRQRWKRCATHWLSASL